MKNDITQASIIRSIKKLECKRSEIFKEIRKLEIKLDDIRLKRRAGEYYRLKMGNFRHGYFKINEDGSGTGVIVYNYYHSDIEFVKNRHLSDDFFKKSKKITWEKYVDILTHYKKEACENF